jgi:hypothetical protein
MQGRRRLGKGFARFAMPVPNVFSSELDLGPQPSTIAGSGGSAISQPARNTITRSTSLMLASLHSPSPSGTLLGPCIKWIS